MASVKTVSVSVFKTNMAHQDDLTDHEITQIASVLEPVKFETINNTSGELNEPTTANLANFQSQSPINNAIATKMTNASTGGTNSSESEPFSDMEDLINDIISNSETDDSQYSHKQTNNNNNNNNSNINPKASDNESKNESKNETRTNIDETKKKNDGDIRIELEKKQVSKGISKVYSNDNSTENSVVLNEENNDKDGANNNNDDNDDIDDNGTRNKHNNNRNGRETFVGRIEGEASGQKMEIGSIKDLLLANNKHYIKLFVWGVCMCLLTLTVYCIIFVSFDAHYCHGRKNIVDDNGMNFEYYSWNHVLISIASAFPTCIVGITIAWFIPSILCLYQQHWNFVRYVLIL